MTLAGTRAAWLRLPLGRVRVRIHLLLPPLAAALFLLRVDLGARYLLLIGTLLLHEMGHAVASLLFGGDRAEVSLWPVFGRADVRRLSGGREALTALSGPGVNLLFAACLFLAGGRFDLLHLGRVGPIDFLLTVNAVMGVGNLLPLPPADGGRAIRAWRRRNRDEPGRSCRL